MITTAELEALAGKPVKCVVWDLDHTLWDGILAEGDDVQLKPGILEILRTLDQRGILHSIASKNSHEDAWARLQALDVAQYFLYPQISWNAKSQGVAQIQKDLNIGIDTFFFIDDQPFERDEVKAAHPQVRVFDSAHYRQMCELECLNPAQISDDAARRRFMYLEDMARKQDEDSFSGTPEAFLATLDMEFTIALAEEADLLRAEELTVRTNQLNSTGVTYDSEQLRALMHSPDHSLLICELTDRYGSYGKIGLCLVQHQEQYDHIMLLLMSCRIVSRGVGGVLLTYLMKQAQAAGRRLRADFRRTERNRQMLMTYQFANFREISRTEEGQILFENDLSQIQHYPPYLRLRTPQDAAA
ncbi:HAD-IIIC family phosphatase [Massilia sp. W12]|uniref:HAD-IIIC family phosphatase n=1 Tax=Massilia sp. W12 TaxID=3126507 RepID=UPI0030D00879